jgi:hypothetical protein
MGRFFLILIFFPSGLYFTTGISVNGANLSLNNSFSIVHDSLADKQLLFNGRVWRSAYSNFVGDEFLYTKEWLSGKVTINGTIFKNVLIRYDILNDQLLAMLNLGTIVQLNKERINGFTLTFENREITFENFNYRINNPSKGFCQIIYKGDVYLIIKHVKRIQELAVENKYDAFYQQQSLYILKGGNFLKITRKKDLIDALSDKKQQVQNYIREERIRIRTRNPESFIPLLKFYDSLKNAV